MYCLGDVRSVTLSPRASRSRSRCLILSRSIATDFMRFCRLSAASSGMASVSTVAMAATAANSMERNLVSWILSIRSSIMGALRSRN